VVEQVTHYPKFKGSNLAAVGIAN